MNASEPFSRPLAAQAYRGHIMRTLGQVLPAVGSAAELIELARRITPPPYEAEQGWRTEPPFPGLTEKPDESPAGWRMICATRLYEGDHELGVIYMTLFSGRTVGVVVSPPGTDIPKEYLPLSAR